MLYFQVCIERSTNITDGFTVGVRNDRISVRKTYYLVCLIIVLTKLLMRLTN